MSKYRRSGLSDTRGIGREANNSFAASGGGRYFSSDQPENPARKNRHKMSAMGFTSLRAMLPELAPLRKPLASQRRNRYFDAR